MPSPEELIARLDSKGDVDSMVEQLIVLGKDALSALTAAVQDSTRPREIRGLCAELVGQIVPEGVEWLLTSLSNLKGEAGDLAAWGLRFNFAPERIEPALFALVSSPNTDARLNAARALQFIYVDLRTWDPVVLRLASDTDARIRVACLELLVELAEAESLLQRVSLEEVSSIVELAARDVRPEVRTLGTSLSRYLVNVKP